MGQSLKHLGIYIHVPFCVHKCAYCDFYSITNEDLVQEYTIAVTSHIQRQKKLAKNYIVDSIFFGGGTPSILPTESFCEILETLYKVFNISPDVEITVEANPGTLDSKKLATYRELGVNRLSIGLQSADDGELHMLSRIHSRSDFEHSYMLARMEGFENINIDIIYGLPKQTKTKLMETIEYVLSMNPEHISFYGLSIEPGTPFGRNPNIRALLPDEDEQYEMYMAACKELEKAGYLQYEISNFAKKDYGCRHNIKYWTGKEYLSFGPSATSFINSTEYKYVPDIERYISCIKKENDIRQTEYALDEADLETRFVMLFFRLRAGVNTDEYTRRFGTSFEEKYAEKLEPYMRDKYIVSTPHGYRFTRKGMLISNHILSDILEFES
ncbi:MAG: radical SAM family heme chaperone HemW [Clostridia bacterium]|nr:radical SAM family heme chaperone HemW [Clostridia bacterium]